MLAERLAQQGDDATEHARRDVPMTPDRIEQFVARANPPGTFDKMQKHIECLRLQRRFTAVDKEASPRRIDFNSVEDQPLGLRFGFQYVRHLKPRSGDGFP